MDHGGWRPFLERWSAEWIAGHDPERDGPLDEDVRAGGWLGSAPATPGAVAAAEARLGRGLPPSLRAFLLVTDGWREAGPFIHRLAGADGLAWLADTDESHWIGCSGGEADEDGTSEAEVLGRSLRLSLEGDAAVMLLDPEHVDDRGEWAAYWLSSWSGQGPERHVSFRDLLAAAYASFRSLREPSADAEDARHGSAAVPDRPGPAPCPRGGRPPCPAVGALPVCPSSGTPRCARRRRPRPLPRPGPPPAVSEGGLEPPRPIKGTSTSS